MHCGPAWSRRRVSKSDDSRLECRPFPPTVQKRAPNQHQQGQAEAPAEHAQNDTYTRLSGEVGARFDAERSRKSSGRAQSSDVSAGLRAPRQMRGKQAQQHHRRPACGHLPGRERVRGREPGSAELTPLIGRPAQPACTRDETRCGSDRSGGPQAQRTGPHPFSVCREPGPQEESPERRGHADENEDNPQKSRPREVDCHDPTLSDIA